MLFFYNIKFNIFTNTATTQKRPNESFAVESIFVISEHLSHMPVYAGAHLVMHAGTIYPGKNMQNRLFELIGSFPPSIT